MSSPIVEMIGVSKSYGPVRAVHRVDVSLLPAEILGIVGDNAAGKSTLLKMLNGFVRPDAGEIRVDGRVVDIRNPRDARGLGIAMQYQDLALFPNLDVAANVFAGRERVRRILGIPFLDSRVMYSDAADVLARLGISIQSPRLLVERMSGGQRQMVAAARALGFNARVMAMDEPTAALGVREARELTASLVTLRSRGVSVVLVTHRIPDVLAIADRVLIMKGGESQGILNVAQTNLDEVITLIVRGRMSEADGSAGDLGASATSFQGNPARPPT